MPISPGKPLWNPVDRKVAMKTTPSKRVEQPPALSDSKVSAHHDRVVIQNALARILARRWIDAETAGQGPRTEKTTTQRRRPLKGQMPGGA
jgi:hypothetical protein